jgi:hypothetical protein
MLLKANPSVWQPDQLAAAITKSIAAKPPPNCTPAATTIFNQTQGMLLNMLLNHCYIPMTAAGANPTSFLHSHIKTALIAGASPSVLEMLLGRAPHWRPDDLREIDAQGVVVYNWVRDTSNYVKLFPLVVRAAVSRGAVHQLVPPLLYLAQPFQRGVNVDRGGYENRMHYFLQALAASDSWVTALDLLPVVKEAAVTRNVKLLLALSAASNKFRWPAMQLAPFVTILAGGGEDYDVSAVKVLLQLGGSFSHAQMAQAVAAAADRAHSSPYLEARGLTQRMCDQLCAGGTWNAVAATAAALNLPAATALLRRLYSASASSSGGSGIKPGSSPVAVAAAAMAAADAAAASPGRLHTGSMPGQQEPLTAATAESGPGQGVLSSAAATAVVAAVSPRPQAGWGAGHGAVITPAPTAAAPDSEASIMALVMPPVVTTAAKPPLSPVMSASKVSSARNSPDIFDLAAPAGPEPQQQAVDPAVTARNLMPPPPNKMMQQQAAPPPAAAPRQPGQAAAVAHGGSLGAPCNLEHSQSEELLALAAATLAAFKETSVATLHHTSTNSNSSCMHSPAPQSPAAPSPRGKRALEMHLNPNMSAAQILSTVAPSPGNSCKGSPCSPMAAGSSQSRGRKAARELPWQQLLQYPEQQAAEGLPGAGGLGQRLQQNEPPIPVDLLTMGTLFQIFQLQAGAAAATGQEAGRGVVVEDAGDGRQQQQQLLAQPQVVQPQQQDASASTVIVKKASEQELAGDAVQVAAAGKSGAATPTASAAAGQDGGAQGLAAAKPLAAVVHPEQLQLDLDSAADKHGTQQACYAVGCGTGHGKEAVENCPADGNESKRQRIE